MLENSLYIYGRLNKTIHYLCTFVQKKAIRLNANVSNDTKNEHLFQKGTEEVFTQINTVIISSAWMDCLSRFSHFCFTARILNNEVLNLVTLSISKESTHTALPFQVCLIYSFWCGTRKLVLMFYSKEGGPKISFANRKSPNIFFLVFGPPANVAVAMCGPNLYCDI